MKLIIGVLAFDGGGYDKMVEACRETCYSDIPENVKVFYLYGHRQGYPRPHTFTVANDCFYNNSPEGRVMCLDKTIAFFEYCLKNEDFDFLLRANCGSYIDIEKLLSFIKKHSLSNHSTYLGIKGFAGGTEYASGSAYLLSKELVELIVKNKDKLLTAKHPEFIMDDVSVGRLLFELGVSLNRMSLRTNLKYPDIEDYDFNKNKYEYHYYFRHTIDPRCFYEVHRRLKNENY